MNDWPVPDPPRATRKAGSGEARAIFRRGSRVEGGRGSRSLLRRRPGEEGDPKYWGSI